MQILVMRNCEQSGPFAPEVVASKVRVGELSRTDTGWHEGLTDWYPLGTLLGLPSALPTTTASDQNVSITGVHIGFWQMVNLIFTFFLASIPALIALFILGTLFSVLGAAFLAGVLHH